jgi:molecular chaperone DnaK (HSP70)
MNIGIDLGTTNSALAYIEEIHGELPDYPEIKVLPIPQFIASWRRAARCRRFCFWATRPT